jgi:large subunit ribosomal protein L30
MPPRKKSAEVGGTFTVRQTSSAIGCPKSQRATLVGLGLGRIGKQRTLQDTPSTRGMARAVQHLIVIEN